MTDPAGIVWQACDALKRAGEAIGLTVAGELAGGDLVLVTMSRKASPLTVSRVGTIELWPGREDMMRRAYQLDEWAAEKANAINLAIEFEFQFALEAAPPI